MKSIFRDAIAAAFATSLMPASAQTPSSSPADLVIRLATIDAELTKCWRTRIGTAMVLIYNLRVCIAERREAERKLKEELNKAIGAIGTDDPLRADFIEVRELLGDLTGFMNALDAGLKPEPEEITPEVADDIVIRVCDTIPDDWRPSTRLSLGPTREIPSLCIKPDVSAPGDAIRSQIPE